ncbi:16S rRNA (guanine(527)-N(7))-methyltransferase RsmG [Veillonella magna]|uniref:16S rRNA (guanine(527)-N(7))-methyltransferase RsmG n=1 Tax=Veillonella magna TaxID=464322 RepID=UPI0026663EE1|nr:16S rRNA (guanine(527)-N(7))-methyltransferase RsmG [Veillonella magna]
MNFTADVTAQMKAFGITLTEEQAVAFTTYYERLVETNQYMNLTAITEPHEVAVKHMVDSLSCYDKVVFVPESKVLDLGTGAGFPGIPLAIYDSRLQITLFDSLRKRLRFLEDVAVELGLSNVTTLHGRAEDMAHRIEHRDMYDIVTSRAVARLNVLAEWALPYVRKGGYLIALKGAAYEEEIKEAERALSILGGTVAEVRPVTLPTLADKRAVIYIKKTGVTPKKYPRKPKEIKERPLR